MTRSNVYIGDISAGEKTFRIGSLTFIQTITILISAYSGCAKTHTFTGKWGGYIACCQGLVSTDILRFGLVSIVVGDFFDDRGRLPPPSHGIYAV